MSLCLVQFIDVLGVTVVVAALPAMLRDLHASPDAGALIAAAYAMFFGGLLMFGARLGDRFGHRRVIVAGTAVFGVAAVVGATAGSVGVLAGARSLQGAAAAVSVPAALRLLTTVTAEGAQRRRAVAAWSAAGAAAGASGFVVGGVVTDLIGWRAVFWGYLPVAVVLAAAILRTVPRDRSGGAPLALNLAGSALFTAAAMAFIVATTLLPERGKAVAAAVTLVGAVVLAVVFLGVDRRAAAPLLPRSVVCLPPLRDGASGSFLNTFTTSSSITLATLYLQNTLGRSPLDAALLLLPFSLAVIGGSALAAPLLSRWAPRRVVAAGLLAIAAFNCLLIAAAGSAWGLPLTVAAGGFGIGLSSVAATSLATTVPTEVRGTASGIVNTAAQLGTALGIAVLLLIAAITTGAPAKDTSAPTIAWVFGAAVSLTGALTFMMSARRSPADVDFGTGLRGT